MNTALNLFVVESRFQALVSLMIARSQPEATSIICYYLEEIGQFTRQFPFVRSVYLGDKIRLGPWKRERTLKRQLQTLYRETVRAGVFTAIHYHCANLKTPLLNYPIRYLQTRLPQTPITVNIITDGTANFQRHSLSENTIRRQARLANKSVNRLFGLAFTPFNRERRGIDADIVRYIYLLPGAPHEYDAGRVVTVPIVPLSDAISSAAGTKPRALVIGEKLTDRGYLSTADERTIAAALAGIIRACGITQVDYARHPTASHPDLLQPGYTEIITHDPIEMRIMQHPYQLVCGIASTALLTARLLQPKGGRTVSMGLARCSGRNALTARIRQAFVGMGIEIHD